MTTEYRVAWKREGCRPKSRIYSRYRVVGGVLGDDGPSFQYGTDAEDAAERFNAVHRAALEWAAGQVEAAGCICLYPTVFQGENGFQETILHAQDHLDAEYNWPTTLRENPSVKRHDPRCPVALAAKVREGAP